MKQFTFKVPDNEKGILKFLEKWGKEREATKHMILALHEYIEKHYNICAVVDIENGEPVHNFEEFLQTNNDEQQCRYWNSVGERVVLQNELFKKEDFSSWLKK